MSWRGRLSVWREILITRWVGLPLAFAALGVAAARFGWEPSLAGRSIDLGYASILLVLLSLLAALLEGSQRAIAKREQRAAEQRRELERLIRAPQRRLVDAKYQLYRDAFLCTQLVGFLTMTRIEASVITPETALEIERSWGSEFLERFQRIFGKQRFGEVFAQLIGGMFPPPREQAMTVYAGLADFLRLLAERITESDLDPAYLHGREQAPEAGGAAPDAPADDPQPAAGEEPALPEPA